MKEFEMKITSAGNHPAGRKNYRGNYRTTEPEVSHEKYASSGNFPQQASGNFHRGSFENCPHPPGPRTYGGLVVRASAVLRGSLVPQQQSFAPQEVARESGVRWGFPRRELLPVGWVQKRNLDNRKISFDKHIFLVSQSF